MKNILNIGLFVLFILSGCSSAPVKLLPLPEDNRLEVLKKSLVLNAETSIAQNASEKQALSYLLGLKAEKDNNRKLACKFFEDLSEDKSFVLKEAAFVHTLTNCDFSKRELVRLWKKTVIPAYLKESYLRESQKLAEKKGLSLYEAQFANELIVFTSVLAEKIKLIKKAISLAEKNDDSEKLKFYRDRLKTLSPLYIDNTDINNQNIFSIAKDFEINREFKKARVLYQQIIEGEFLIDEKVKSFNALRMSYKIERDLKTFLQKTFEMEAYLKSEMDKNPDDQKIIGFWVDSKIILSRAVWTDHQNEEARKILEELLSSNLGTPDQQATAEFVYGSICLESKENIKALKHYEKALTFKVNDLSLLENIQWAVVWNNYLLQENKKVVSFSDLFIKQSSNKAFIVKLEFWKAQALLRFGENEKSAEANILFEKILASDPFGFYGIMASASANSALTPLSFPTLKPDPTGFLSLDWLMAMEEQNFSEKYLKEINSKFKTYSERENAMPLYFATKWYQGGMRQIYNFKASERNAITEKYIGTIFPLPFPLIIQNLSQKYSVPKELILAIARQESAFVPSERSPADAFGIMQLIPEKALELSKKYQIPYRDYTDLYNPKINLEMGTALLKDLRENFKQKFIQTVSGYNASEKVINTWEKERFNGNYLEFIEMIPYEETRNYVKLVFRNYITYKRITADKEFRLDKDFFAKPF